MEASKIALIVFYLWLVTIRSSSDIIRRLQYVFIELHVTAYSYSSGSFLCPLFMSTWRFEFIKFFYNKN